MKKIPALLLLIGAVVLLQTHSIKWWSQYDAQTGWLWAVVIEAGAIWLWTANNWLRNSIAACATALALIAPLHELAAPVLEQQQAVTQAADSLPARTEAAQARVESLEASLAQYNANSEYRAGWHGLIVSTQEQLSAARSELANLQAEQTTPVPDTLSTYLPIAMQMIAMVLLQCLVVLTTRSLFTTQNRLNTAAPAAGEPAAGCSGHSQPFWKTLTELATESAKNLAARAGRNRAA